MLAHVAHAALGKLCNPYMIRFAPWWKDDEFGVKPLKSSVIN
jgi:hypothetical protein